MKTICTTSKPDFTSAFDVEKPNSAEKSTNQKVHSLVILGNILLLIGIALIPTLCISVPAYRALASVSSLVHTTPVLATLAAPIPFLLTGTAILQYIKKPLAFLPGNLNPLMDAMNAYKSGESVSSTKIRNWLQKEKVTSNDLSEEDDPSVFLTHVLKKIGYSLPEGHRKVEYTGNNNLPLNAVLEGEPLFLLHKKKNLQQSFENYFSREEVTSFTRKGESKETTVKEKTTFKFLNAPKDFFVAFSATSTGNDYRRNGGIREIIPTKCPKQIKFTQEQVGEATNYECNGFCYHRGGSSGDTGHWQSVVKLEEKWWNISDMIVSQITEDEAYSLMETATLMHFRKVLAGPLSKKEAVIPSTFPKVSSDTSIVPRGLRNEGGLDCWINSVIQLLNLPEFDSYFQTNAITHHSP